MVKLCHPKILYRKTFAFIRNRWVQREGSSSQKAIAFISETCDPNKLSAKTKGLPIQIPFTFLKPMFLLESLV